MSDKRKVSTDALETLGTIIGPDEKRDAIHLAVIPVQARAYLKPGDHVNAQGMERSPYVGIVDPFIRGIVPPGDWFWLVIYPRQITSLRHVWSHPSFPEELPVGMISSNHTPQESEDWLRAWLHGADQPLSYERFIDLISNGATSYNEDEDCTASMDEHYIYIGGRDAGGEIPDEVWTHVENVIGKKVPYRPTYFSCSC
jgi:hypothetical protein